MVKEKILPASRSSSDSPEICPTCLGGYGTWSHYITNKWGRPSDVADICPTCKRGEVAKERNKRVSAKIPHSCSELLLCDFDWNIYKDKNGNSIDCSTQKELIESFVEQFTTWRKKGIAPYICSMTRGAGKTTLASCICNELMKRYQLHTRFVLVSDLIEIQQKGANSSKGYKEDTIRVFRECDVLVLDDYGQKKAGTDWTNDILFQILTDRMNDNLPTIITSNILYDELDENDRNENRIKSLCFPIPLPEYCVRAEVGNRRKIELLKELKLQ